MRYVDRVDAGRRLAAAVAAEVSGIDLGDSAPIVLGIPRGGVVVAGEVADHLGYELDLALARKVGAPGNPELAIGAVGESGPPILAEKLIRRLGVSEAFLDGAVRLARHELSQRAELYRSDRKPPVLAGRVTIVVDDGIATGATLQATLQAIKQQLPHRLICAVPVGPPDSVRRIAADVDVMVCPTQPRWFRAVGEWYDRFSQTTDAEVMSVLRSNRTSRDR